MSRLLNIQISCSKYEIDEAYKLKADREQQKSEKSALKCETCTRSSLSGSLTCLYILENTFTTKHINVCHGWDPCMDFGSHVVDNNKVLATATGDRFLKKSFSVVINISTRSKIKLEKYFYISNTKDLFSCKCFGHKRIC